MVMSMTGYGKSEIELHGKRVHVEIKSLNSKGFDLTAKISSVYREKEMGLRAELSSMLVRGKVDFMLWVERDASSTALINVDVFKSYCTQISQLSKDLSLPLPADWFTTVLRMPEVVSASDVETISDEEWGAVHDAIIQAANELVAFRKQEGEALNKKLMEKVSNIKSLLEAIEPHEKERVEKIKLRIADALEKHIDADYDKNRFEQELIYYIEKLDINEEKQRLANHIAYFIDTLGGEPGQGKKLGFIAQEMGREINTLGSKSNHAEMQQIVVRMKDELEQIKEQVLNVM